MQATFHTGMGRTPMTPPPYQALLPCKSGGGWGRCCTAISSVSWWKLSATVRRTAWHRVCCCNSEVMTPRPPSSGRADDKHDVSHSEAGCVVLPLIAAAAAAAHPANVHFSFFQGRIKKQSITLPWVTEKPLGEGLQHLHLASASRVLCARFRWVFFFFE